MELSEDDRIVIAEIVLDGVLGEHVRMEAITSIDVVGAFEQADLRGLTNIKLLAEHLQSLRV